MNSDIWTNLLRQMFVVQIAITIFRKLTHNVDFSLSVQSLPFIWYFSVCWNVFYWFQRWALQTEWLETTQPVLLMTSLGVRDHTTSSADDQIGSQGPHSQLCWWPARESGTTQPTLLMTSLESGTTQPALLRNSLGVTDHMAYSAEKQPGSQGPQPPCVINLLRNEGHIQVRVG